jgi:hypothetical protein
VRPISIATVIAILIAAPAMAAENPEMTEPYWRPMNVMIGAQTCGELQNLLEEDPPIEPWAEIEEIAYSKARIAGASQERLAQVREETAEQKAELVERLPEVQAAAAGETMQAQMAGLWINALKMMCREAERLYIKELKD